VALPKVKVTGDHDQSADRGPIATE
jgi:hypothetical protein